MDKLYKEILDIIRLKFLTNVNKICDLTQNLVKIGETKMLRKRSLDIHINCIINI